MVACFQRLIIAINWFYLINNDELSLSSLSNAASTILPIAFFTTARNTRSYHYNKKTYFDLSLLSFDHACFLYAHITDHKGVGNQQKLSTIFQRKKMSDYVSSFRNMPGFTFQISVRKISLFKQMYNLQLCQWRSQKILIGEADFAIV